MIEMYIDSIRVSTMNYQRVVILKEKDGERYLPIWIGRAEADAIAGKLEGLAAPRPLTHDFACLVINALGGKVKSAIINDLQNDIFYSKLMLEVGGHPIEIDCRPSDALAIAVRVKSPIVVDEEVFRKADTLIDAETGKPVTGETTCAEEVQPSTADHVAAEKLKKFSTAVREIFARAEEQSRELNSKYVGTGHLLLALVEKAPNTATDVLARLGINVTQLLSTGKLSIDAEQPSDSSKITLNNNAKRVIELSLGEATRLASQHRGNICRACLASQPGRCQ